MEIHPQENMKLSFLVVPCIKTSTRLIAKGFKKCQFYGLKMDGEVYEKRERKDPLPKKTFSVIFFVLYDDWFVFVLKLPHALPDKVQNLSVD